MEIKALTFFLSNLWVNWTHPSNPYLPRKTSLNAQNQDKNPFCLLHNGILQ